MQRREPLPKGLLPLYSALEELRIKEMRIKDSKTFELIEKYKKLYVFYPEEFKQKVRNRTIHARKLCTKEVKYTVNRLIHRDTPPRNIHRVVENNDSKQQDSCDDEEYLDPVVEKVKGRERGKRKARFIHELQKNFASFHSQLQLSEDASKEMRDIDRRPRTKRTGFILRKNRASMDEYNQSMTNLQCLMSSSQDRLRARLKSRMDKIASKTRIYKKIRTRFGVDSVLPCNEDEPADERENYHTEKTVQRFERKPTTIILKKSLAFVDPRLYNIYLSVSSSMWTPSARMCRLGILYLDTSGCKVRTKGGNELYICGGLGTHLTADIAYFNCIDDIWREEDEKTVAPFPRINHKLVNYKNKYLILFGGFCSVNDMLGFKTTTKDFFTFDLAKRTWKKYPVEKSFLPSRAAHSLVVIGDYLVTFGGFNSPNKYLLDSWIVSIEGIIRHNLKISHP